MAPRPFHEEEQTTLTDFDEDAYLSGKVPILGGSESKPSSVASEFWIISDSCGMRLYM